MADGGRGSDDGKTHVMRRCDDTPLSDIRLRRAEAHACKAYVCVCVWGGVGGCVRGRGWG